MSRPAVHVVQSISSSALLYPVLGENVIPFGLAIIFVDLDHVIKYIIDTKDLSLKGFFVYHDIILKNMDKNYLEISLFHTIEFYLLILLSASSFPILYYVLTGFLFHHLVDQIFLIRMKRPFLRASSIIEYIIRRKKCLTSVKEILQQEDVNVEGIRDLSKWQSAWGVKLKPNQLRELRSFPGQRTL